MSKGLVTKKEQRRITNGRIVEKSLDALFKPKRKTKFAKKFGKPQILSEAAYRRLGGGQ
jgi:hypothetical protein